MDAVILDVGGVLLVPHEEPVNLALAPFGIQLDGAQAERAHYFGTLAMDLAEDDERILMLATLAVRHGQFVPGPAADHALTQFAGTSRYVCDTFLTTLVHIALDDALGQARHHGVLPPRRAR